MPASLAKLKPLIEPYAGGLLWDPVMVSVLAAPAWSLLGVVGILLLLLGRKKKPLIGYALARDGIRRQPRARRERVRRCARLAET